VCALHCVACRCITRLPCKTLKPYWNDEVEQFKNDSIFWHNLWLSAGKPTSGVIQQIRLSSKAKYKLAVRTAYLNYENDLSDEMYEQMYCHHFMVHSVHAVVLLSIVQQLKRATTSFVCHHQHQIMSLLKLFHLTHHIHHSQQHLDHLESLHLKYYKLECLT